MFRKLLAAEAQVVWHGDPELSLGNVVFGLVITRVSIPD